MRALRRAAYAAATIDAAATPSASAATPSLAAAAAAGAPLGRRRCASAGGAADDDAASAFGCRRRALATVAVVAVAVVGVAEHAVDVAPLDERLDKGGGVGAQATLAVCSGVSFSLLASGVSSSAPCEWRYSMTRSALYAAARCITVWS